MLNSNFRQKLIAHFVKNPVSASLKGQSGQKVSVLMDAIDEVDSYFSSYIPQVIRSVDYSSHYHYICVYRTC